MAVPVWLYFSQRVMLSPYTRAGRRGKGALPEAEGALALRVIALSGGLPVVQHPSQLRCQREATECRSKLH